MNFNEGTKKMFGSKIRSRRSKKCELRFFTLIELLIVIAIIAILAGMLLPALNKARAKAQQGACVSKMKQLNLGFTLYLDDNKEFFPLGAYPATVLMEKYFSGVTPASNYFSSTVWFCPANPVAPYLAYYNPVRYSSSRRTLILNKNIVAGTAVKCTQIKKPSQFIVALDAASGNIGDAINNYSTRTYCTPGIHSRTVNFLFFDGHCANFPDSTPMLASDNSNVKWYNFTGK